MLAGASAIGGRHPVGALPGLQVRLGAAEHVGQHRPAAALADLLQPVGIQAVVGEALLVEVERALPPLLAGERDAAVVGPERVTDFRQVGPGLGCESVHVRPPAEAERVLRLADSPVVLPGLDECTSRADRWVDVPANRVDPVEQLR